MIKFLFKGLLRDKNRSLLPVIVVSIGVTITVFLQAYLNGVFTESIESTAKFSSGHVKVMTMAYKDNLSQMPNDYALSGIEDIMKNLQKDYTQMDWTERIQFGGLLDVPDSVGQTRAQGNVVGMGIQIFKNDNEINRMDLKNKLMQGKFPSAKGEILVTNELFNKLKLKLNDPVTLLSSTMYGDMAMYNFRVSGTLHFGTEALDRGLIVADINDVRAALNMEDAAGEVLGFFRNAQYDNSEAKKLAADFNLKHSKPQDRFSLVMLPMSEVGGMDFIINYAENAQFIIILIFVFTMSIVLWNAGLVAGLRRYGEFGLRLAIGENKNEIYSKMIMESLLIGLVGSITGTAIGLFFSYLMQTYGIDTSDMMKNSTLMTPTVFRSQINVVSFFIGFIPGVISTVIGGLLAGIGIYKRQTATLFKELEN